jgi:hypothetical protein
MTLLNRILIIAYLALLLFPGVKGQEPEFNDSNKDIAFANFLFNTRQYDFASEEYLKQVYLQPENTFLKKRTLESFRLNNNMKAGLHFSKLFFDPHDSASIVFYPEIVKLRLLSGKPILTDYLLIDSSIYSLHYNESLLLDYMMSGMWKEVHMNAHKISVSDLYKFTQNTPDKKQISPFLATTFSTIIPGTGKIYARRWKDGLSSFLFVGLTAFQSYRGFNKSGINSTYGWIMGGLSFGFYLGNIYGSYKAADNYNKTLNEKYLDQVVNYYIDHY